MRKVKLVAGPYQYGEYPLHITRAGDTYEVDPEEVEVAEEFAITATFPADRLAIMQARAATHGYVLIDESIAADTPPVV